jgi:hypothetical protein
MRKRAHGSKVEIGTRGAVDDDSSRAADYHHKFKKMINS